MVEWKQEVSDEKSYIWFWNQIKEATMGEERLGKKVLLLVFYILNYSANLNFKNKLKFVFYSIHWNL